MRDTLKTHIRSISHFCLLRHTCNVPPPVDSSAILSWQLSAPQYVPTKSCLFRNSTVSPQYVQQLSAPQYVPKVVFSATTPSVRNMSNSCLLRKLFRHLSPPQYVRFFNCSGICSTVVCSKICPYICLFILYKLYILIFCVGGDTNDEN